MCTGPLCFVPTSYSRTYSFSPFSDTHHGLRVSQSLPWLIPPPPHPSTTVQYEEIREEYLDSLSDRKYATLADARERRLRIDFVAHPPPKPATLGVHVYENVDLARVAEYIDWKPFFEVRGEIWASAPV